MDRHPDLLPTATFDERAGALVPVRFDDPAAEVRALTTGAGLLDLSAFGRVDLTGKDRVRYLHGMITHDVEKLEVNQGRYATIMTANGRTITDLWVFAFPERLRLVLPAGAKARTLQHLDFYLIADKAELVDVDEGTALLSVQGPGAAAILREVGLPVPEEDLSWREGALAGAPAVVYAVDRGGRGGFDVEVPEDAFAAAWAALAGAGAHPAGFDALNVSRVEAGIPWTGWELTDKVIPMEVGVTERAVSFKKGCFIGQEVLAKIKYRGKVNRLLVAVDDVPDSASEGERFFFEGKDMGWLSSVVVSPTRGRIGLGVLHRKAIEAGEPIALGEGDDAPRVTIRVLSDD